MEWELEWGERKDGLEAVERQTKETPKALLNRPRLHPWLTWLYDAFWLCDSGRRIYQGSVGRIPLSEMVAYMSVYDVGEAEERQLFITMMRALDSVYVKKVNAEIARKVEQDRRNAERRAEEERLRQSRYG